MANPLKQDTKLSFFINLAILLSIGLAIALFFFYAYLPITTNHGETQKAPDLAGMSEEAVIKILEEQKLRYEIIDSTYNPDIPPKAVISQNPRAGADLKENRKIYLTTNYAETPAVKIPLSLITNSQKNAENQIRGKGLIVGEIIEIKHKHSSVQALRVNGIELNEDIIKKGYLVKKGQVIDIVVGDGKGSEKSNSDSLNVNEGENILGEG